MGSKKDNDSFKIGRDAESGKFKSVDDARKDKAGSVVETIKKPR